MFSNFIEKLKNEIALNPGSSRNPVKTVLNDAKFVDSAQIDTVSAKIGLVLVMMYSDMKLDVKERIAFAEFVKEETGIGDERIEPVIERMLAIPQSDLEIAYFSRIMCERLDEKERTRFLLRLFKIARSDGEYDFQEEKDLHLVAKYFFLDHNTFIALKLASKS